MPLHTDEYGQVHNSPELNKFLAEALKAIPGPQIFRWADDRSSAFILMIWLTTEPRTSHPRLYVGLEGYGFAGFPVEHYLHPLGIAESLRVAYGSAEPLAELLNGIMEHVRAEWVSTGGGVDSADLYIIKAQPSDGRSLYPGTSDQTRVKRDPDA